MRLGAAICVALLLCSVATYPAFARAEGPPGDRVNRPGGATCRGTICHGTVALSPNNNNLSLGGVARRFANPAFKVMYVKGALYDLTFTHQEVGRKRWGFELAVLDTATSATNVGQLQVTDAANTQLITLSLRNYIEQTLAGTCHNSLTCPVGTGCPDTRTWQFAWQAPTTDTKATIYACSNAANSDCNNTGADNIRCTKIDIDPDPALTVTYLGIDAANDVQLDWGGGVGPFNVWMHAAPNFDDLSAGTPLELAAEPGSPVVLPDCGGKVCYYLVE
jgi:hypothetical protein